MSTLSGQCPDRALLWKQMSEYQNSHSISFKEQLNNLLQYERKFKDCTNANDSVYAWLNMRIGVMYYNLAEYVQAIQYTRRAMDVVSSNQENKNIRGRYLAKFFYNLSICYDSLGMIRQRNEAIDSCISFEMKSGAAYQYSFFLLLRSIKALYNKGEYNICIDHASLGESIIHKYYRYSDSMDYIIFFISYKAKALFALEKYDEASLFLQSRQKEFSKIRNKYYSGVVYTLFGELEEAKGNYKSAIDQFLSAFNTDKLTAEKFNSAEALSSIGVIYADKFKDPVTAMRYFTKALIYSKDRGLSELYADIAKAYRAQKKYDSASYFFQKAFDVIKPGINESDILLYADEYTRYFSARHLLNLVLNKADACLEEFYTGRQKAILEKAFRIYKIADQVLNKIKTMQAEQESKLFWRSYTRRLYEHAIEACFYAGNTNNTLYFFERSRSVLLNDQLNENHYLSESDILNLAQLKKKISYTEKVYKEDGLLSNSDNDTVKELFLNRQKFNKLQQAVKSNNPFYYQAFFDTGFVSIGDIRQHLLKNRQSLLELFNGDSAVFSLTITASESFLTRMPKHNFDSLTGAFNSYLSDPAKINAGYSRYINAASGLYALMSKDHPLPVGRIVISPDGQYFPFEALITSAHAKPVVYFLQDHIVSYTYSARFLMNKFVADSLNTAGDFMGCAPVSFPPEFSLTPLQGSDNSLKNISGQISHQVNFTSADATMNNFLQQFYRYKIIQLYTHSSDSSRNKEPAIYFADSVLFLSDLINEKKTATKLIVLSACETGNGTLYKGEGVFSFNRAFAAVGVASSITNLWSIDNQSTYKLTELFYKYILQDLPLDVALQKAKLEYIRTASDENRLPYYWAAPVLVGKTDAIAMDKPFAWKYALAAIAFAGLIFLGWKKISEKKLLNPTQGKAQTAA